MFQTLGGVCLPCLPQKTYLEFTKSKLNELCLKTSFWIQGFYKNSSKQEVRNITFFCEINYISNIIFLIKFAFSVNSVTTKKTADTKESVEKLGKYFVKSILACMHAAKNDSQVFKRSLSLLSSALRRGFCC